MFIPFELKNSKKENYITMLENVAYFLVKDDDTISNLANLSAYINYFLKDVNWVGFYLFDGSKLILGPFQGLPACNPISLDSGVCGASATKKETMVIKDVHLFPGHIACDGASNSEIVVPIILKDGTLFGVLDIDSPLKNTFDEIDQFYLEEVIKKLVDIL